MLHHDLPQKLSKSNNVFSYGGPNNIIIYQQRRFQSFVSCILCRIPSTCWLSFPISLLYQACKFFIQAGTSKRQHGSINRQDMKIKKFRMHILVSRCISRLNQECKREIKRYPQCNFLRSFGTGKFSPFSCCGSLELDSSLIVHSLAERIFGLDFPISSIRPKNISKKSDKTLKLNQNSTKTIQPQNAHPLISS